MALSMGSTSSGSLSMGTASSKSIGGPSKTSSPQKTYNPQPKTYNPQTTVGHSINQTPYYAPITTGGGGGGDGSGNGTGGGGYIPAPAYVDPYAAWGGTKAYNKLVSGYDDQIDGVNDSIVDATRSTGLSLNNSILDLIDSLKVGQTGINNRAVNNELAKIRGTADVYGSINRGIQSGGVRLANSNSQDSSAAGAIARAYGGIGQRQLSSIGNQYELQNGEIALAQEQLDMQERSGIRRINTSKEQAVNDIVADAQDKLSAIDAAMANADLPDKIALSEEKGRIRKQVLGDLSKYDSKLKAGVKKINPSSRGQRLTEATRRNGLGQANPLQFQYDTETPVDLQGTGPVSSQLPIFTNRYRKD